MTDIRCSICGAPLNGQVCEYCGTRARNWGSSFQGGAQGFAQRTQEWGRQAEQKARDWGRQAEQKARNYGRQAKGTWEDGRDSRGRFTAAPSREEAVSTRSKWVAFVLCLLLGRFGVHRFYAGKMGTGFLYLITGGFKKVGVIVDLIMILTGNFTDGDGKTLR